MSDNYQYGYTRPKYNIGVVEILIIINVIFFIPFIIYFFTRNALPANIEYNLFALNINSPDLLSVEKGNYWQLVTAMFMHGSFSHIIFNMYGLFMFGKPLEIRMGKFKFLSFYMFTGIFANIASAIFYKIISISSNMPVNLIGASGAIFGVILAFGTFYPDVKLLLFFVIPIKTKWVVLLWPVFLYVIVELLSKTSGQSSGIAHITHLFGYVFAFLYLLLFFRINAIKEMFFTKRDYY